MLNRRYLHTPACRFIRRERKDRGLDVKEFAQLLKVSPRTVQFWEAGQVRVSSDAIFKLKGEVL